MVGHLEAFLPHAGIDVIFLFSNKFAMFYLAYNRFQYIIKIATISTIIWKLFIELHSSVFENFANFLYFLIDSFLYFW